MADILMVTVEAATSGEATPIDLLPRWRLDLEHHKQLGNFLVQYAHPENAAAKEFGKFRLPKEIADLKRTPWEC